MPLTESIHAAPPAPTPAMAAAVAAVLDASSAVAAQLGGSMTVSSLEKVEARRQSRTLAVVARALAGLADADHPCAADTVDLYPLLLRALDQCALSRISESLSFKVCLTPEVRGPRRVHAGLARQMAASLLEAATLRTRAGLVRVVVDVTSPPEAAHEEAVRIAVRAPMDDRSVGGGETVRLLRLLARTLGGELAVGAEDAVAVWTCVIPAPRAC